MAKNAVRLNIAAGPFADEIREELLGLDGVWEDQRGAYSYDPGVVGFIIEQGIQVAAVVVAYLAGKSQQKDMSFEIRDGQGQPLLLVKPDHSDQKLDSWKQRLAEQGGSDDVPSS